MRRLCDEGVGSYLGSSRHASSETFRHGEWRHRHNRQGFRAMNMRASNFAWFAVVAVIGLNLRPLLTSVPVDEHDTFSDRPVVSWRFDAHRSACRSDGRMRLWRERVVECDRQCTRRRHRIGLLAIVAACAGRFFAGDALTLVISAAIAGTGVAIIQALLPGVMKTRFAARLLFAMGLYSASIMAGGGLAQA